MVIPYGANLRGSNKDDRDEPESFSLSKTIKSYNEAKARKRAVSESQEEEQEIIKTIQPRTSHSSPWGRARQFGSSSTSVPGQASDSPADVPVPPISDAYHSIIDSSSQSLQIPLAGRDTPSLDRPLLRERRNSSVVDLSTFLDSERQNRGRSRSITTAHKPLAGDKEFSTLPSTQQAKAQDKPGVKGKLKAAFTPGFLKSSKNTFNEKNEKAKASDKKDQTQEPVSGRPSTSSVSTVIGPSKPEVQSKSKAKPAFAPGFLTSSKNAYNEKASIPIRSSTPGPSFPTTQHDQPDVKGRGKEKVAFAPGFLTSSKNAYNDKPPAQARPGTSPASHPTEKVQPDIKGKGKAKQADVDVPGPVATDYRPPIATATTSRQSAEERLRRRRKALAAIDAPKLASTQGPPGPPDTRPATAAGDYTRPPTRAHASGRDGHTVAALITEVADKRMCTFDYLKKAHEGHTYWFNTLYFGTKDLERQPWFESSKLAKRANALILLGFSVCEVCDASRHTLPEFLANLNGLMVDFEQYQSEVGIDMTSTLPSTRVRVPDIFKRVASGQQSRGRRTSDMAAGSSFSGGPESSNSHYNYLMVVNLPGGMDYYQAFKTVMDAFSDMYLSLSTMVNNPANLQHLQVAANVDLWTKADTRIKKALIYGLARDFEHAAREGMRSEMAGVARLAFGGLA